MAGSEQSANQYVITLEAVRASIDALRATPLHPYFPAYLHLRQKSGEQGATEGIAPNWNEIGVFLNVPGNAGRPYFRPFGTKGHDESREWLNPNLAGSYAKSSLRSGQPPLKVVEANDDGTFTLPAKHWELARLHLASDQKVSALAVAGFYFRNFAFEAEESPTAGELVDEFRLALGYSPEDEVEFNYLFTSGWEGEQITWFEPFEGLKGEE